MNKETVIARGKVEIGHSPGYRDLYMVGDNCLSWVECEIEDYMDKRDGKTIEIIIREVSDE